MGNIIQDILGLVVRKKPVAPKDKDILVMAREKKKYQFNNIQDSPDLDDQLTTVKQLSDYIVAKVPNELPNPGTEGQVLALNASLDPIWKDDADTTSTTFKNTDIDASVGSYKGDVYETTTSSVLTLGTPAYVSGFSDTSGAIALSDITALTQMNRMMGVVVPSPVGSTGNTLLIKGLVRVSAVGLFIGAPVYFVNGGFSTTAPSTTGQYVRIAGHCVAAPFIGDPIIYFNPSPDFILLS